MAVVTVEYHQARTQHRRMSVAVAAGETTPWYLIEHTASVVVSPGVGGSMRVERTQSPPSYVLAGNGRILCQGESHSSKRDALRAVRGVRRACLALGDILPK